MYNDILDTFITVVNEGSFSKAADSLFISSVAIMKQMNNFEANLGFKVFKRTSQGITLTEAGKSIYKSAKEIINLSNREIEKAQKIALKDKTTIRIATSLLRSCQPITQAWSKIAPSVDHTYSIKIVPFEDNPSELQSVLKRLNKDIDLMVGPINLYQLPPTLDFFNLGDRQCNIAVPKTNPLSQKEKLTWKDLNKQTFALIKRGLSPKLDELREEILQDHPQIQITDLDHFYDMESFNYCAENNYLMETLDIWSNLHPAFVNKAIDWDYTISYGIISSTSSPKEVKEFISLAGEQYLADPQMALT